MFLRGPEEPKPTLWEYRREVLKKSEMYPINRDPDDLHLQTWNGLGLLGWELVSVVREDDDIVGYLKREQRFGVIEEEWRQQERAADIERENSQRVEEESLKEQEELGFLTHDDDGDEPLSDYEKKRGF